MMRIDVKRRDVGKITPAYFPAEFDRPAHFSLGDKFFDAHGREIVPGQPLAEDGAGEDEGEGGADQGNVHLWPAALVEQANTMGWPEFKARAKELLGPTCPQSKPAIVAALTAMAEGRQVKAVTVERKRDTISDKAPRPPANGAGNGAAASTKGAPAKKGPQAWPPKIEEAPPPKPVANPEASAAVAAPPAAAPKPAKPATARSAAAGIDLAAWARGEQDHLNGNLQREMKKQYGVNLSERHEMLAHLIGEGVVTAEEARADL